MKNGTQYYIAGGVVAVGVLVGVIVSGVLSSPPVETAPITDTSRESSGGSDDMNSPEKGLLVHMPAPATKIENKAPASSGTDTDIKPVQPKPVTRPPSATGRWHEPAPVDPKSLRLRPLKSPSILVEKSALRLTVFDGDAGVKSYRIAVGSVRGDKQVEGDRKTPEGDFYICIRKPSKRTPYTRSMGLSYPNIEDARRGIRNGLITTRQHRAITHAIQNNQTPPWKTKLGGEIMIHGKRENRTGTLGCVALDDDDIIELYNRLPINTSVRIIP
ncbi:MAG: L,D-transpeptidase [bacterium]|nr:L,D-transpeptidase [bacterium]